MADGRLPAITHPSGGIGIVSSFHPFKCGPFIAFQPFIAYLVVSRFIVAPELLLDSYQDSSVST